MNSQIIIMLTHNDRTVPNALEVFESCKDLPVKFWGFKDVGLPKDQMRQLIGAMKAAGKTTFLEVVSYSEEECMAGAKLAVEMGFDYLMGTVYHQSVFEYLATQKISFLPFCGTVYGSPSVLEEVFRRSSTTPRGCWPRAFPALTFWPSGIRTARVWRVLTASRSTNPW